MNSRLWIVAALALLLQGAAQTAQAEPPREAEDPSIETDDDGGNFLVIPGIGKIPMPPGVRAYGPGNNSRLAPNRLGPQRLGPEGVRPAPETRPPTQAEELERLFARLAEAEDQQEALGVSAAIQKRWSRSGSETIDLLSARAAAAEAAGAAELARTLLDYVVALSPYWPEGFVRRARLRANQNDMAGALNDLDAAAKLEPKRFDAFATMGALAEKLGDKKKALDSYRRALAISPRQDDLRKVEERLKVEVEGRDI